MALAARLEVTFTSDGAFDVAATFGGLADMVGTVELGDVRFDPGAVIDLVAGLEVPDLAGILGAAADVSARLSGGITTVPSPEVLLGGLTSTLDRISGLGSFSVGDLSATVSADVGLPALSARLRGVTGMLDAGPIGELAGFLSGALPGLSLADPIARLDGTVGGVVALLTLLGGLVTADSLSMQCLRRAGTLRGMVRADVSLASRDELLRHTAQVDLIARIRAADPRDLAVAETLTRPVVGFLDAVHRVADEWGRDLGFGEAALLGMDVAACGGGLAAARIALDPTLVPLVATLAASLRSAADGVMSIPLPDPAGSIDAALEDALGLVGELTTAVRGYQPERVTGAINGIVDTALAPLRELAGILGAVGTEAAAAIRAVRQAVEMVDLAPVRNAIEVALRPVTAAMDAVEDAVASGTEAIESVADTVIAALAEVRASIQTAAGVVRDALGTVADIVEAIDFGSLQASVETGLGTVADTLASAQFTPYIDASIGVIDTTASVVDAIPFGMLPTDLQADIVETVRPIKQIDFEAIAGQLRGELAGIVAALDTDVLVEVDAAYQEVVAFLESIDPGKAIRELEEGPFAEFRQIVEGIDPTSLLAPVEEVLGRVRTLLAGIDVEGTVLGPLNEAFDDVRTFLTSLDPGPLLQPAVDQVAEVRTRISEVLHLDQWTAATDSVRSAATEWLGRIDPRRLSEALTAEVVTRLRPSLEPGAPGVLAETVAALARASGLPAEATSLPAVLSWFGEIDGQLVVEGRLRLAAEHVVTTRDVVRVLDPAPLVTAAQAYHRGLLEAVGSHPVDSLLRRAIEPLLTGTNPGDVLGPLVENRRRLLGRLDLQVGAAVAVAGPGWSQIAAVTGGMRDALAPVASILSWLRVLLARFGIDPDRPLSEIPGTLLELVGPQRLLPPLVELVEALRDKAIELVDAALAPAVAAGDTVRDVLDALDLGPVVAELTGLHGDVTEAVESVSPQALLGDVVGQVQGVVDRLEAFDPLAPVRAVADALSAAITETFDTLAPSVLFQDAIDIHARMVELAGGLNVRLLLEPVLTALEGLRVQLDAGLEEVAAALTRLQEALPDRVTESGVSGSVSVEVAVEL
jgi:hypothetical protein